MASPVRKRKDHKEKLCFDLEERRKKPLKKTKPVKIEIHLYSRQREQPKDWQVVHKQCSLSGLLSMGYFLKLKLDVILNLTLPISATCAK